jgi:hypothetical protein
VQSLFFYAADATAVIVGNSRLLQLLQSPEATLAA